MRLIDVGQLCASDVPAPEALKTIVDTAVRGHASDIHFAFQHDGLHIAFRIDGQLANQGMVAEPDIAVRLANHVKILGDVDVGERRKPQRGRAMVDVDGRSIDLRISALPTLHGQDLVIRVLDRRVSLLDVERLGLSATELNRMRGLAAHPNGLILVTGPTGAGKTTTLYALLNELKTGEQKIITLEDPIEYDLAGINQAQINRRIGVDYATLMPTVLQHDPDIIMIGELRDTETVDAAVRAAVTGHLVFATTHSQGAAEAIDALIGLGAHPHFLARALRGVIAQNLVRRVCDDCRRPLDETESLLPVDDIANLLPAGETVGLAIGRGCKPCHETGYRGRMGLFEIMVVDPGTRRQIEQRAPASAVHRAAIAQGMITLQQAGKVAAFLGHTTIEEVLRQVPIKSTGDLAPGGPDASSDR